MLVEFKDLETILKKNVALAKQCEQKLEKRGKEIRERLEQLDKEITLWGPDLYKRVKDHDIDKTLLMLSEALANVEKLFNRVFSAKYFVLTRYKKDCKRCVAELDHVISLLGMKISYLTAKTAWNGVNQLGLVAGYPTFEVLDLDQAAELCLHADKHFFGHGVTQNYEASFRLYLASARAGYPRSQYCVGTMSLSGQGTKRNEREGVKWILSAAKSSYPDALNHIGVFYRDGTTVLEKNPREAVKFFLKSAKFGHLEAMTNLAGCLLHGIGVKRNESSAVVWLKKAVDGNHAAAQNQLGNLYYNGIGVERDLETAVDLFRRAAEQGDIFAINNLGICYEEGNGVVKDYVYATLMYQKAADLGYVNALNNLGYIKLLQQQFESAKDLLHDAADRGSIDSYYNLGILYEKGLGVVADIGVAFKYYSKAADAGHAKAQRQVGDIYYSGTESVPQDRERAAEYYYRSALQGDSESQNNLGIMHEEGIGVKQDIYQAVKWFKEAASTGHVDALYNLALLYESGKGIERNFQEARDLFQEASANGHQKAREKIADFRKSQEKIGQSAVVDALHSPSKSFAVPKSLHRSIYATVDPSLSMNSSFARFSHMSQRIPDAILVDTEDDMSEEVSPKQLRQGSRHHLILA